ncbi:hypothetical protein AIOL_003117 [Candidatus Rhodobacter oscarellae]|uniref:Uncharacterized protein n=1 Tax=Candidatus Rhodobacter oscarellae TaxID=1675527 RepID=A0A0J9E667_9RHOB|nr:hypothetical protein [Candidatus Rhodobacter lobularis]KMW58146.1 hypothetical protein AIOL_003117 [Candidatus Rhodobacter lobularis]
MTAELNLTADARIEFGFGTVKTDKQDWMYGVYFPYMAPTMAEHGLAILAGFGVIATNFAAGAPQTGSFASWPSAAHRAALHSDPRFLAVQPDRDAAMDLLSGGHLFQSMDDLIALNTDKDYAVIIAKHEADITDPIFVLPLAEDSPEQVFAGKSIILRPWSDADELLLGGAPTEALVFRVRFSPSAR